MEKEERKNMEPLHCSERFHLTSSLDVLLQYWNIEIVFIWNGQVLRLVMIKLCAPLLKFWKGKAFYSICPLKGCYSGKASEKIKNVKYSKHSITMLFQLVDAQRTPSNVIGPSPIGPIILIEKLYLSTSINNNMAII